MEAKKQEEQRKRAFPEAEKPAENGAHSEEDASGSVMDAQPAEA